MIFFCKGWSRAMVQYPHQHAFEQCILDSRAIKLPMLHVGVNCNVGEIIYEVQGHMQHGLRTYLPIL